MHRTTIELDEKIFRTLKETAAREGKTFKGLTRELVRLGLEARRKKRDPNQPDISEWRTAKGSLPPGINPADRSSYWRQTERDLP